MRRLASSFLLALILTAAALTPGAAVFATPTAASCAGWDAGLLSDVVVSSDLIVVARVADAGERQAVLKPEAYLKGPAQAAGIVVRKTDTGRRECPYADLPAGRRVVAFLRGEQDVLAWPDALFVFNLDDGSATNQVGGATPPVAEDKLVSDIRGITQQYAVPAQSESEGEGIEWGSTVFPVAVALGIVFLIGLFLMRIWHRIDPS